MKERKYKMNDTVKLLLERKSVRVYTDEPVKKEDKALVLEAALQAPTAGNMTLYTILDITDQKIKERLAVTCDNQPFIATAPMVLVFCADYRRWYESFLRHVDEVRKPSIGDLFLAQADTFIAAQSAVVAAESMGLGTCYIGDITENFEEHREMLKLPKYVVPTCMICIGHPTEQQKERLKPVRFAAQDIVHENSYSIEKSDRMDDMLFERGSVQGEDVHNWIVSFCNRKWNCDFSKEMSRSCQAIVDSWCCED